MGYRQETFVLPRLFLFAMLTACHTVREDYSADGDAWSRE